MRTAFSYKLPSEIWTEQPSSVINQLNAGWGPMREPHRRGEISLVRKCLSGSEQAWTECYQRYVFLVRSVVRKRLGFANQDLEDIVQTVFVDLIPALHNFDPQYPLPKFIYTVAERVCINEYHKRKAACRDADTDPIDHHDGSAEGARMVASGGGSPEDELEQAQLRQILRRALWELSEECWKLLTLRDLEELSFKEISGILGEKENTLTVKARRCRDELRATCHELVRKGCGR